MVWTNAGGTFYIGSSVSGIKDLVSHAEGRGSQSLASGESFVKTQGKIGAESAHAVWFLDVAKVVKLVTKASARERAPRPRRSRSSS